MSELKVDTLTGKTTATTVTGPDLFKADELQGKTSAGDITVTSEGGAVTMQLQQGLVKWWVNAVQTSTPHTATDSLNIASLTDNGTGKTELGFINNMNNAHYCASGLNRDGGGYNDDFNIGVDNGGSMTTSAFEFWCHNGSIANDCGNDAMVSAVGDLA